MAKPRSVNLANLIRTSRLIQRWETNPKVGKGLVEPIFSQLNWATGQFDSLLLESTFYELNPMS